MRRIIVLLALLSTLGFAGAQNLGVSSAQWIRGSGAPSLSCSATAYNGVFYTDKAASVLYQCFPVSGTWTWHAVGASGGGSGTVSTATANAMAYYSGTGTTVGGAAGLSTPGAGMLSSAATDPLNETSSVPYIYSSINGGDAQTEFRSEQGGLSGGWNFVSPIVGLMTMNNSGNISGGFGVMGLCDISNDGGEIPSACVGVYGQGRVTGNSMNAWGGNFLAGTNSGTPGTIRAAEFDTNARNTGDQAYGITVQGSWAAQPSAPSTAVLVEPLGGIPGVHWTTDFECEGSSATTCLDAGPTVTADSEPSMPITLDNYDSGGMLRKSTVAADAGGDVVITPYSGVTNVIGALEQSGVGVAGLGSNAFFGTQTLRPTSISTPAVTIEGTTSAGSPVAFVQSVANDGSSASLTTTISVGDTLILGCYVDTTSTCTFTDTQGNTFTQLQYDGGRGTLLVATNVVGGADTITAVTTGGSEWQFSFGEFTSSTVSGAIYYSATNTVGSPPQPLGPVTTTAANGMIVYGLANAHGSMITPSSPSGLAWSSGYGRWPWAAYTPEAIAGTYTQNASMTSSDATSTNNFAVALIPGGGAPQSTPLVTNKDIQTGSVTSGIDPMGGMFDQPMLFAALPTCTASTWSATQVVPGTRRFITDSTEPMSSPGVAVGGGGGYDTPVRCVMLSGTPTWVVE